jgi:hypothetical protein
MNAPFCVFTSLFGQAATKRPPAREHFAAKTKISFL